MLQNLKNSSKIERVKNIEFQILKQYDISTFANDQLVYLAQGLLNALIDEVDLIIDSEMPNSLLGVELDWSAGNQNDHIVRFTKGDISIIQNLTLDNVVIPGFNPELNTIYTTALGLIKDINNETSVPDVGYLENDKAVILSDALTLMLTIRGE